MSEIQFFSPKLKLMYRDRDILYYLYNNAKLSDIVFIVKDKRFPANRCVLSAASDVFQAMLQGPFHESSSRDIVISDVEHHESFSSVLSYIYGLGVQVDELSVAMLLEVLTLAERYRIPILSEALRSYVSNLNLEKIWRHGRSFVQLLSFAFTYKIEDLYAKMVRIVKRSPESFLQHKELVDIHCPILREIFEDDYFCAEEVKILETILKWIDTNCVVTENGTEMTEDDTNPVYNTKANDACPGIRLSEIDIYNLALQGGTNQGESTNQEATSDIVLLLRTVRTARISLPDISIILKSNHQLIQKLGAGMAALIFSSENVNYTLRKPYRATSWSTSLNLEDDFFYDNDKNLRLILRTEYGKNEELSLKGYYEEDESSGDVVRPVSWNYSLHLRSPDPFGQ